MGRVVLVDEAYIRRLVEMRLKLAGFEVPTAADGQADLELIRKERPPVVVLDLMMPGMHGFAVCQATRSDPELLGTYIIVGSAKAYAADIKKTKELGG